LVNEWTVTLSRFISGGIGRELTIAPARDASPAGGIAEVETFVKFDATRTDSRGTTISALGQLRRCEDFAMHAWPHIAGPRPPVRLYPGEGPITGMILNQLCFPARMQVLFLSGGTTQLPLTASRSRRSLVPLRRRPARP
jgi:hypothetical protein